ncbi:hypothetical protein H310_07753 [Aphanomyces invadans]|uniref:SDR family NAD(P)-dependent oxidoreductase n=1 Tax=Aphanomyces invadans TaxID=157072 RepID=A0A024U098_9STRA|nr:hypothetical protein H310_07753 [Aphanomyces invadans]ETV99688.1 hypothetical protein H310_07753 [Aphanomyces invadans]RHY29854.1 hypothetical protein DYB32_004796 [Aphanomyces invadans]|eukprot:XP_008871464.1 hypothetical protein H310_07753 [Aphanomyces invadans]
MRQSKVAAISAVVVVVIASIASYSQSTTAMRLEAVKIKNADANLQGQTALVVGGTSGIGEGIALRLAQARANVVIAGRNADRGNAIVAKMQAIHPSGTYRFLPVDAQYIGKIRGLSAEVPHIDKLVLTQGIATIQGYTPTSEGIDQKLALHYYGRMAFIEEFLPSLRQSKHSPRVLSVLSAGVHSPYDNYVNDPELKSSYSLKNAADAAGFYNDLMLDAYSQAPANAAIAFGHSAPGFVATNWGTEMPWAIRMILKPLKLLAKSKTDCGEFMADFLLRDDMTPGKLHLMNAVGDPAHVTAAHTQEAVDFLAAHTLDRLKQI